MDLYSFWKSCLNRTTIRFRMPPKTFVSAGKERGFSRAAAAPSAEGDRCPRRVQCRDGRSRGKVCCCVSRNKRTCILTRAASVRPLFSHGFRARVCFPRVADSRTCVPVTRGRGARFHSSRRRGGSARVDQKVSSFPSFGAQTPRSEACCEARARALSFRAAQLGSLLSRLLFSLCLYLRQKLNGIRRYFGNFDWVCGWVNDKRHVGTRFRIFELDKDF